LITLFKVSLEFFKNRSVGRKYKVAERNCTNIISNWNIPEIRKWGEGFQN